MHLTNDSPSFTPVHSQIRAIGPQDLHLWKGRGRADHDAHADTCGKLWAAFGHKWAHLRTFYRPKLLISIAPQLIWPYTGGPIYCQKVIRSAAPHWA